MKEIFEQYGGIVITVTAILAIILIIRLVIGNDLTSPIGMAFKELIENFMKKAATESVFTTSQAGAAFIRPLMRG